MNSQVQARESRARKRSTPAGLIEDHSHAQPPTEAMIESERLERIATAAYFRAERRGFQPGHELEDWLASEAECNAAPGSQVDIQQLGQLGSQS